MLLIFKISSFLVFARIMTGDEFYLAFLSLVLPTHRRNPHSWTRMATQSLVRSTTLERCGGRSVRAFLSHSERAPTTEARAGVILLSDVLGYENEDTRAVAERIAATGIATGMCMLWIAM